MPLNEFDTVTRNRSTYFVTPVDELTGLPACFAPTEGLVPVPGPDDKNIDRPADWNHMFPRFEVMNNPESAFGQVGKIALMNLRAQWVEWHQHHDVYNYNFVGPKQPLTEAELARTSLFGLSGEVPEIAIDLSGFSPKQVGLTMKQRKHLWESGQVKVLSEGDVRKFLFEYVMQQDVDHIRTGELMEFLREMDMGRRIYKAHCLAAKIVERAVAPFQDEYSEFRLQSVNGETLPTNPRDFLKQKLIPRHAKGKLVSILNKKLGAFRREHGIEMWQPAA